MPIRLSLEWEGPFAIGSHEERLSFFTPPEPGVYLWIVARKFGRRISYIGQALDLRKRIYEHVFWTLGGACSLYDDDHIIRGENPIAVYEPGHESLFRIYLDEYDRLSQIAFRNLAAYEIYWARLRQDASIREAAESALITKAKEMGEPLQNTKTSRGPSKSRSLIISSPFPAGTHIHRSVSEIVYGLIE